MAMVYFPKVTIMFCFQIWLFPWSCQEWPNVAMYMFPNLTLSNFQKFPNLALSIKLPRMAEIGNVYVSLARNGNVVCPRIPKSTCTRERLLTDRTLEFAESVQQGDPLGPLLFCLCIHHMGSQLPSELYFFYLDDGTLGGSEEDLRHDVEVVERVGSSFGLMLIWTDA